MSFPVLSAEQLQEVAARLPRVDLAHLPTPLEEVPRFAERVGPVRIFLKRDDCTGMLFGGNKTRHNEFLLADALRQGADVVVWGAGVQSNNCRQTAAACAKLGLECHLYLSRANHAPDVQGNLLLDHLVGAKVHIVEEPLGPELDAVLAARRDELRAAGRRPYAWDRNAGRPLAAVSYTLCLAEVLDDMKRLGLVPDAVYSASAGPTGSGLALGKSVLGMTCPLRLVCPIRWPWDPKADMADVACRTAELLGLPHRLTAADVDVTLDYIGKAYGAVTPEGREALDLMARTEGILLDPVYTSKAMAALIHDVRHGRVKSGSNVVFIHTGGQPAVFAYRDELMHRA